MHVCVSEFGAQHVQFCLRFLEVLVCVATVHFLNKTLHSHTVGTREEEHPYLSIVSCLYTCCSTLIWPDANVIYVLRLEMHRCLLDVFCYPHTTMESKLDLQHWTESQTLSSDFSWESPVYNILDLVNVEKCVCVVLIMVCVIICTCF